MSEEVLMKGNFASTIFLGFHAIDISKCKYDLEVASLLKGDVVSFTDKSDVNVDIILTQDMNNKSCNAIVGLRNNANANVSYLKLVKNGVLIRDVY